MLLAWESHLSFHFALLLLLGSWLICVTGRLWGPSRWPGSSSAGCWEYPKLSSNIVALNLWQWKLINCEVYGGVPSSIMRWASQKESSTGNWKWRKWKGSWIGRWLILSCVCLCGGSAIWRWFSMMRWVLFLFFFFSNGGENNLLAFGCQLIYPGIHGGESVTCVWNEYETKGVLLLWDGWRFFLWMGAYEVEENTILQLLGVLLLMNKVSIRRPKDFNEFCSI